MEDRERNLLIAFGCALVAGGFYYGILPMYYEYGNLRSKIQSNVRKIQKAQTQAARLETLVEELKKTKLELKKAKQKLPEKGRFRELMSSLETQARKAGIPDRKILEFSQGSVEKIKDGLVEEMSISARFSAITMEQLVEMLWRFDHMIRMLDIKSFRNFSLQRVENENRFLYNINMNMTVYILQEEKKQENQETQA